MNSDAKSLNTDAKHDNEWLRAFDAVASLVQKLIPEAAIERTRDVYQFTMEDPEGVIVFVTPDEVDIRLPTIEWTQGYAGPAQSSRRWKRLPLNSIEIEFLEPKLVKLIGAARRKRKSEIKPCALCRSLTPPEGAHTIDGLYICHGCSESQLGVVH